MKRLAVPVVLVAAVLGVGLVAFLAAPSAPTSGAAAAAGIAADLRCPDCQSLSVAESRTAASAAIRAEIVAQLDAGRTPDEVRQHFVDRYGAWILLRPALPLAWIAPLLALAAGVAWLGWWISDRRTRPLPPAPPAPDAATRRRLADEAEALDA